MEESELKYKKMIKLENFSNYEIYPDEGKVFSLKRNKFIGSPQSNGYWKVTLTDDNGKAKTFQLHNVIWMSVHGQIPEGMEINHLDEDKSNCAIWNLSACSHLENINYGSRNQRIGKKLTNGVTSKKVAAYKDNVLFMTFPSTREAGRHGYDQGSVAACCRGKLSHYKGFIWRYIS